MILRSAGRVALLIAGLSAVVALAVPAWASPAITHAPANKTIHFASCRSSGEYAACAASGSVNHPIRIKLHVEASPNQGITGYWAMTCTRGGSDGHTSGPVSGHTPRVKELRMPFTNPDSCSVETTIGLDNSGSLYVYLAARIP